MAQEKFGFFESSGEDIRSYSAADMAAAFHALASNGVTDADTCLRVTAEGSTMRTLVGYGTAMIEGHYYRLRDDGSGIQAFTHTTEAELSRIDRMILRLDLAARTISLEKVIGMAAATPEAPALTRNAETYEISLAQVLVRAGADELLPSDITDERADDAACGVIAPESLRRSAIAEMIDNAIEAAIAEENADVLRLSQQTLTESEQAQARENIDAVKKTGTSTAIQKGDGNGDTEDAVPGEDYGAPVAERTAVLSASWSGSTAPFTQAVTVSGMTTAKKAIVGLPATVSQAQYLAAMEAMLRVSSQGTNTITITAEGTKPTISIPVLIEILG